MNPWLFIIPAIGYYFYQKNNKKPTPTKKIVVEEEVIIEKEPESQSIFEFEPEPEPEPKKSVGLQVDKGFVYDCASIQVTNAKNARRYFASIINKLIELPEFSNPETIILYDLALAFLRNLNEECYNKFTSQQLTKSEFIIVILLFKQAIEYYLELVAGVEYESSAYYTQYALPQLTELKETFAEIPNEELEFVEKTVFDGNKYP